MTFFGDVYIFNKIIFHHYVFLVSLGSIASYITHNAVLLPADSITSGKQEAAVIICLVSLVHSPNLNPPTLFSNRSASKAATFSSIVDFSFKVKA